MSGQETQQGESLSEHEVADYLRTHPKFFQHHDYLLNELVVTHPETGQAVSLIERQVSILRDQKLELKQQLQQLTQVARTNEQLLERLQRLLLKVLDSANLEDAIIRITSGLKEDFHADEVTLLLLAGPAGLEQRRNLDDPALKSVGKTLSNKSPLCGHLRSEQLQILFGPKAGDIASAVLLPLCKDEKSDCIGLLGIGSIDPKRFHPTMDTAFIGYLGSVLSRILNNHLT